LEINLVNTLVNHCTADLNTNTQDQSNYGYGWSQYNLSYLPPNGYQSIYKAFQVRDAQSLQGSSIPGQFSTYDGSGYLYEMRGQLSYLQGNLSLLKEMNWVDRQTRAVFVEFSVYNPNSNLIMVSTILIEFLSSGSILTTAQFDPLNLFQESSGGFSFKTICEIILLGFIVYFMIKQIKEIANKDLKEYSNDFWTYIEWSIILSGLVSFAMILVRLKKAKEVLDFFKLTAGYGYMKLQTINECNQVLIYALGLYSSFGTIKFLKMLRFNKQIAFLGLTMKRCFGELVSFSLVFFLIWFAFVQWMYLIYGSDIEGYETLVASMSSAFSMMLGKFDAESIVRANSSIGPIAFSMYNIVMICFTLNIFISIIIEAFDHVRHEAKNNPDQFDFMNHTIKRFKKLFKKSSSNNAEHNKQVYRDHLSVFPNRINKLINFTYRVNLFLFKFEFQTKFFISGQLRNLTYFPVIFLRKRLKI
jgi:polycystin 1L2